MSSQAAMESGASPPPRRCSLVSSARRVAAWSLGACCRSPQVALRRIEKPERQLELLAAHAVRLADGEAEDCQNPAGSAGGDRPRAVFLDERRGALADTRVAARAAGLVVTVKLLEKYHGGLSARITGR